MANASDPLASRSIGWAIDLGNTRIKLGRFVDGKLREYHTWPNAQQEEALAWLQGQPGARYALLQTAAPSLDWRGTLSTQGNVYVYGVGAPCPLTIEYETPSTLGHDRLAAAVGAHAIYPACDLLILDIGTCITYEYVSADSAYQGGNISPGLDMRLKAMHAFTGKLPLVTRRIPDSPIGVSTQTAMQNGAIRGAAAEITQHIVAFRQNHPQGRVLVCGGDVPFLRPLLPDGLIHRPSLVVEGLANLQAYAQSK